MKNVNTVSSFARLSIMDNIGQKIVSGSSSMISTNFGTQYIAEIDTPNLKMLNCENLQFKGTILNREIDDGGVLLHKKCILGKTLNV